MTDRPERPGPDATAAEIKEWMEKDFGWALAEGVEKAVDKRETEARDGKSGEAHEDSDTEDT